MRRTSTTRNPKAGPNSFAYPFRGCSVLHLQTGWRDSKTESLRDEACAVRREKESMATIEKGGPCNPACTNIIKFYTDKDIPANTGISQPPYNSVDGYRYINIFVKFTQEQANE